MALLKYEFLTLILCFSSAVLAQKIPTITHITPKQILDIGKQVDLACSVLDAHDSRVLWVRNERQGSTENSPISLNAALITRDNRYALSFKEAADTHISTSTLSIKDVQEADAGWYQCLVLLSDTNRITADVELEVKKPSTTSDNSTKTL